MTTLMFYQKPVVVDRVIHRQLRLKPLADGYSYAASCNAIPIAAVEFSNCCHEYPIVFVLDGHGGGAPVALTGLRDGENLFVTADQRWDASYVPAFVQRYPFVLQDQGDNGDYVVMVDEASAGFGAADGEPIFAEDGSETPALKSTLEYLNQYKMHTEHTKAFIARVIKYDLLIPRVVDVEMRDGRKFTMEGFYVVDEERLAALDDAATLELVRSIGLGRIYAHLLSLPNLEKLVRRLEQRVALEPPRQQTA